LHLNFYAKIQTFSEYTFTQISGMFSKNTISVAVCQSFYDLKNFHKAMKINRFIHYLPKVCVDKK